MTLLRLAAVLLTLLAAQLSGCSHAAERAAPPAAGPSAEARPNQALLDEVNAARAWFHARKTRPIWARRLQQPERVKTLEGTEDVPAGHFVCRGEAGDIWPQAADRLAAKYEATDEVAGDGWRKYVPRPDDVGVLAARMGHSFTVRAAWGSLTGKPGDLLVKNFSDRDVAYPSDVWIVDQALFRATYRTVAP